MRVQLREGEPRAAAVLAGERRVPGGVVSCQERRGDEARAARAVAMRLGLFATAQHSAAARHIAAHIVSRA